jgi:Gas vesicle synthesis protein GvpL/GvpF
MSEELARWAAERAAQVRAKAEAEAVATLRDALVAAALGEPPLPRMRTPHRRDAVPAEAGELWWAYCVLRAGDPYPEGAAGIEQSRPVERVEAAGLAALVSRVPRAEFGEEPLRENLNDLGWLERVARAHEAVLDQTLGAATIVPLRICTLYESEERVRQMLTRERASLTAALDELTGREEWGVKVLVDPDLLAREARSRSEELRALEAEVDARGDGGAYMLRRRLEREVRELADALAAELAEQVQSRLGVVALDGVTRSPQNPSLSGHEGSMVLNAAYLVDAERVDELRQLVVDLNAEYVALGARIELTGPWPPYNFVPGPPTSTLA